MRKRKAKKFYCYAPFDHITTWYYLRYRDAVVSGDEYAMAKYEYLCDFHGKLSHGNEPRIVIV